LENVRCSAFDELFASIEWTEKGEKSISLTESSDRCLGFFCEKSKKRVPSDFLTKNPKHQKDSKKQKAYDLRAGAAGCEANKHYSECGVCPRRADG
jgi:hypothetical protein